jgi:hypothetical protein
MFIPGVDPPPQADRSRWRATHAGGPACPWAAIGSIAMPAIVAGTGNMVILVFTHAAFG